MSVNTAPTSKVKHDKIKLLISWNLRFSSNQDVDKVRSVNNGRRWFAVTPVPVRHRKGLLVT